MNSMPSINRLKFVPQKSASPLSIPNYTPLYVPFIARWEKSMWLGLAFGMRQNRRTDAAPKEQQNLTIPNELNRMVIDIEKQGGVV